MVLGEGEKISGGGQLPIYAPHWAPATAVFVWTAADVHSSCFYT